MSNVVTESALVDETKLVAQLLHKRTITECQLKAALDYQRSVGGRLFDVLIKLNLIREQRFEELLAKLESPEVAEGTEAGSGDQVLDPSAVNIEDLKVHRRLLEKVPVELIKQYLLVLFFPPAGISQRKIVVGYGREPPPDVREKVRAIVGVEICTILLEPAVALSVLREALRGDGPRSAPAGEKSPPAAVEAGSRSGSERTRPQAPPRSERTRREEAPKRPQAPASATPAARSPSSAAHPRHPEGTTDEPAGHPVEDSPTLAISLDGGARAPSDSTHEFGSPEVVVQGSILPGGNVPPETAVYALASLLVKKGLIAREEIEVEIEIARLRQKAEFRGATRP